MNLDNIKNLVDVIERIDNDVESIDRILDANKTPETVDLYFDFDDLTGNTIIETISVNRKIYADALAKQKELLLKSKELYKNELINEIQ